MAVTILEALENAEINLVKNRSALAAVLGASQLHNAITLLGKGYDPYDEVEPLLEQHGTIEDVPEKQESV